MLFRYILILFVFVFSNNLVANNSANQNKIVSLSLASDEILVELLSSANQLNRLGAVSKFIESKSYSSFMQNANRVQINYVKKLPKVGSRVEQILRLKPSLVFVSSFNHPKYIQTLKRFKIKYVMLKSFNEIEDIRKNIRIISESIDLTEMGDLIIKKFDQKINEDHFTTTQNKQAKSLSVIQYSIYDTPSGKGSLMDSAINHCGAINAVKRVGWSKVSRQTILRLKPDLILLSKKDLISIDSREPWLHLEAVKKKKYIFYNPAAALSTSQYFANFIHHLCKDLRVVNEK